MAESQTVVILRNKRDAIATLSRNSR